MAVLYTNASAQYLTVPNESDYDFTAAMSITGWFLHNGLWKATWENIVSKGDGTWRLGRYTSGTGRGIHWATSGTSGGGGGSLNWDGTFDDDAWHFLGVTYLQGSPGSKYIFLDGAYVATDTALTGTVNTDAYQVYIAENSQAVARYFDGLQHDLRIYNRQLSFAELTAIWRQRGGDTVRQGLVSRWVGNQGAPGVVVAGVQDEGSFENDASPVASPTWDESLVGHRRRRTA